MTLLQHTLQLRRFYVLTRVDFVIGVLLIGLSGGDLIASTVPSATTAPAELNVNDVLARVRKAIGYKQLQRYEDGILVEGAAQEFAVKGKYSLMFTPDGKFLEKIESQYGRTVGFDGTVGWTVDSSGMPRVLELAGLELWQLTTWVYTARWLALDSGYSISILDKYTDGNQVALSIRLESGVWELWLLIDRTTWFPTSVFMPWSTKKGPVMRLKDYRPVLGFQFPHRIVQANFGSITKFEIRSVKKAPCLKQNSYTPIDKKPDDTRFDQKLPSAIEYKFAKKSHHILVHPRVNGQDVGWFILDCGAGGMVIDPAVADQLNMPSFGRIAVEDDQGTTAQSTFRQSRQFKLGPITISNLIYCEVDLDDLSRECGHELAGICGYDLFSRSVIELDLKNGTIRIHDPACYSTEGTKWQELFFANRLPCVRGRFEGDNEGLFAIDTGFPGCLTFNAPAVDKFDLLEGRETTTSSDSFSLLSSSRYKSISGRIEWFELAGHRFTDDFPVTFERRKTWCVSELSTVGDFGFGFFFDFKVIFDYPHKRIAFVPLEEQRSTEEE